MENAKYFSDAEKLNEKYKNFLYDIAKIESQTSDKEGVDKVGNYIIDYAKKMGWDIEIDNEPKSGNAICIIMNKEVNEKPIVFSGHMDTVHPKGAFGDEIVSIDGNIMRGPGVADCKGGIAVAFCAMEALQMNGYKKRPVIMLLQSDEEVGSKISELSTIRFMKEKAKNAVCFINDESGTSKDLNYDIHSSPTCLTSRKGILRYEMTVKGISVHSSVCYLGKNAVLEAANKIIEIEKNKDKDGITMNCSVINGGTVSNVVADKCTFDIDIRFSTNSEAEKAEKMLKEVAEKSYIGGTSSELKLISYRPPMERIPETVELFKKFTEISKKYDLPIPKEVKGTGGADAAYMTAMGIPSIDGMGIDGGRIHSTEEFAITDSISVKAKYHIALALEL